MRRWALTEPERLHYRLRVTEPEPRAIDRWLLTEPDRVIPSLLLLTEADRTCCLLMNSEHCWGWMNSSQWGLDEQDPMGVEAIAAR